MRLASTGRLAAILGLSLSAGGCYSYIPVRVTLVDAVDRKPVAGAVIHVDYARMLELFPPDMHSVTTDAAGGATVRVATNYPSRSHQAPAWLIVEPLVVAEAEFPFEAEEAKSGRFRLPVERYEEILSDFKRRRALPNAQLLTIKVQARSASMGAIHGF